MKLREFEGKALFNEYGIPTPEGILVQSSRKKITIKTPLVLKAQVLSGDRKKAGGIQFVRDKRTLSKKVKELFTSEINGESVEKILVEEQISAEAEYYASFSYNTDLRSPVLAVSKNGGTGVKRAKTFPINIIAGLPQFVIREYLKEAGFKSEDIPGMARIVENLWHLFTNEYATLAEINPIIKTKNGDFVAADAKVILDDDRVKPKEKRILDLGGDIAIIASGGGASMLNIDALMKHGGKPANYTEYSGNPPASVVTDLTKKVLSRKGIKGCWVIGGTANFTDIYETMNGFVEGLKAVKPKPKYPIVIRRDGPRQKEAKKMLLDFANSEGFEIYIFDSETSMEESARLMVKLAYKGA